MTFEQWETKTANAEVTPKAIWPIAKSPINRVGPRALTANHGPSGIKFHPLNQRNCSRLLGKEVHTT
jgi:hypothetical protein